MAYVFTLQGPRNFDPICSTVDISFIERLLLFFVDEGGGGGRGRGGGGKGKWAHMESLSFLFFVPFSMGLFRVTKRLTHPGANSFLKE